jgi:hypothetical protein
MLIYSMGVSVDGFIADREGAFGWTAPGEEQFRFHIAQTRELGGYLCGRRRGRASSGGDEPRALLAPAAGGRCRACRGEPGDDWPDGPRRPGKPPDQEYRVLRSVIHPG